VSTGRWKNGGDPRWNAIELPEFGGSVYPLPVTVPEKTDLGLLDDNIAELKRKLKGYKELRKIVRERERGRADREGSPHREVGVGNRRSSLAG
jgi:hypothetical protein